MDSSLALGRVTITLHWAVASLMTFQIIGGLIMIDKFYSFYSIHKSIGILALLVIISRVLWRIKKGWPTPVNKLRANEQKLARFIHWVLICGTVAMPLSGMLASGASGYGFGVFDIITFIPINLSTVTPDEVVPYSKFWMDIGYTLHTWIGYTMIAAISLHITGALKHHVVEKDSTLRRMLG